MKRVMQVLLVIALLLLMIGFVVYKNSDKNMITFNYQESDDNIYNPARGFYEQLYVTSPEDAVRRVADEGNIEIILLTMDISAYRDSDISKEDLNALANKLKQCRESDLMVVFRASYKQDTTDAEPDIDLIKSHIKQLSEVINEYSDVVYDVQAGMLGLWGEWHTSRYLPKDGSLSSEAIEVIACWLDELDQSIVLNLRRPSFIREATKAGLDSSRLGYHDDGLLGSDTDLGTYTNLSRQQELDWAMKHLNARVNGGEMPYVNEYTSFDNAKTEFDKLSITYLNYYYNRQVLDSWTSEQLDYIDKHLGYRYSISSVKLPSKLKRDFSLNPNSNSSTITAEVRLTNTGFSSIAPRFKPYLVVVYDDGQLDSYSLEKIKSTKREEILQTKLTVEGQKNFAIAIAYTDGYHDVKLANSDLSYLDGHNYFIEYDATDKQWNMYK